MFQGFGLGLEMADKGRGEERVKEEGKEMGGGVFSWSGLPDYLELDGVCLRWVS